MAIDEPHQPDLQQDIMRASQAKQVLTAPIYRESWEEVRRRIVEQLESAEVAPERRARLNDLLVAHKKARQYLEQVMNTGKLAELEINRRLSLVQRIRQVI